MLSVIIRLKMVNPCLGANFFSKSGSVVDGDFDYAVSFILYKVI
jgi:hypothetical protein